MDLSLVKKSSSWEQTVGHLLCSLSIEELLSVWWRIYCWAALTARTDSDEALFNEVNPRGEEVEQKRRLSEVSWSKVRGRCSVEPCGSSWRSRDVTRLISFRFCHTVSHFSGFLSLLILIFILISWTLTSAWFVAGKSSKCSQGCFFLV